MGQFLLNTIFIIVAALLLTTVSYGIALLLRSKYTPITISGGISSTASLCLSGVLLFSMFCCCMPYGCYQNDEAVQTALEAYKEEVESERRMEDAEWRAGSNQWHYGRLSPSSSTTRSGRLFETPAKIQTAGGEEFRFIINWVEDRGNDRRTAFSGTYTRDDNECPVYTGTWFTAGTRNEGEWTLIRVSDDLYSGWITDRGDNTPKPFYLRQER